MHRKQKKNVYKYHLIEGLPQYFEGKLVYIGRPKKVKLKGVK
jgi:hypothetical protein